ncbi:hypothetical protein ABIE73_004475 [Bradyrhizobium yuanmingense]
MVQVAPLIEPSIQNVMSAQLAVVGDEYQQADARIGDRGDGDAGEQEDRDRGASRAAGDAVEDCGGRQRTREGRERQQLGLEKAQRLAEAGIGEDDRARGCERAATGDADQGGIGERVAKQPLHDRAGRGKQTADHRRRRDPGNADRPQHELVAGRHGRAFAGQAQRGWQPGERDAGGADRQSGDRDDQEHDEQEGNRERCCSPSRAVSRAPSFDPGGHAHCRQFAVDSADANAPPSAKAG